MSEDPDLVGAPDRAAEDGREMDATRHRAGRAPDSEGAANGDSARTLRADTLGRNEPTGRENLRRLGPLDLALLALIALGIAVTVTMAIVNP